jgi:hypothetical protein
MVARVVSSALKHVWTILQPLNLPMAVMGGIALARWQHVRATRDVDLLLALGNLELDQVLASLRAGDVHSKHTPPVVRVGSLNLVQLSYEAPETFLPVQIDLLMAETPYHHAALARRVSTQIPELQLDVAVLTCEDLILHKLLAGRLIDRADATALLRANRPTLEMPYLTQWLTRLGLDDSFGEIWSEAFPGESAPH